MYTVYILHCADETYYTGITTDLARRLMEHNSSPRGARYTRSRRPVAVVYQKRYRSRSTAAREEHRIKRLSRVQKRDLINTLVNI